jgi:enamine deaminase RidA (YjgF/YER057c/UK114 family)
MKKSYPVKRKLSLKENIKAVLPLMWNNFLSFSGTVVSHPRMKMKLHEMRKIGKPIRYAMEITENAFDEHYRLCLKEIKEVLEIMGEIHDCDVNVHELTVYLKELRQFNKTVRDKSSKIPTSAGLRLIRELREKRQNLFAKFCLVIEEWERVKFNEKLLFSIGALHNNVIPMNRALNI